ncbi:S1C family serine protease [Clostridium sp. Marseille-QA1073]
MDNQPSIKEPSTMDVGGDIIFKKTKNKKKIGYKIFINIIFYIIIASLSGAITAKTLVKKEFAKIIEDNNSNKNSIVLNTKEKSKAMSDIANKVSASVVSISKIAPGTNIEIESGAGTIIREDGYIVTNQRIVYKADELKVKLSNNKVYTGKVIGSDAVLDIAIIKIDEVGLPAVIIGDSSKVEIGDEVIAIGNPIANAFQGAVSFGEVENQSQRISVTDRQTRQPVGYNAIRTNIEIFSGNTGGPLCNLNGEMIGINNNILSYTEKATKSGFAITIEDAKPIIDALMKKGNTLRLGLGIYGDKAIPKNGVDGVSGVYVKDVLQDSEAYKAGIRPTDIITSINDINITDVGDISRALRTSQEGHIAVCKVWRNGEYQFINVKLAYYRMLS